MKRSVLAAAIVGAALITAPHAAADTPGCTNQFWMLGLRATTRHICDGPIAPDGSWLRGRQFYAPAYYVPFSCSWSYYSGYCGGNYWTPVVDIRDVYVVTLDTVLPDEPGHIDVVSAV